MWRKVNTNAIRKLGDDACELLLLPILRRIVKEILIGSQYPLARRLDTTHIYTAVSDSEIRELMTGL